jgi:tetrahydromethanopterin S-methyltransferase subunit F
MADTPHCGPGASRRQASFIAMILNCVLAGLAAGTLAAVLLACITLLLTG